jgi:bifunctional DNase/RNase
VNQKEVIQVEIRAVIPTATGTAVFVGNDEKIFVIYVDSLVGNSIGLLTQGVKNERPLTHDLMGMLLASLGAKVDRVIINDLKGATYYGRMIVTAENELQQRKVIELDARPSDCLAMSAQQKAPIYVTRTVWDEAEDMSEVLKKMGEETGEGEKDEGEKPET